MAKKLHGCPGLWRVGRGKCTGVIKNRKTAADAERRARIAAHVLLDQYFKNIWDTHACSGPCYCLPQTLFQYYGLKLDSKTKQPMLKQDTNSGLWRAVFLIEWEIWFVCLEGKKPELKPGAHHGPFYPDPKHRKDTR